MKPPRRIAWVALGAALACGLIALEVRWTRPVREAVRAYTELIAAANRGDLDAARGLCTERYVRDHGLKKAGEGGVVGLPRNINKNFQAWREGSEVWLCPSNRVGPVLRFVRVNDAWKFDGKVGLLVPGGRIVPMDDEDDS